jgi:hypothetical protein
MKHLLLTFLVLIAASCSKEVEIEQPPYTQKIVVDGYIEQGKPAFVFLTLSSPFLTNYDSVSIRQSFLNYAKVVVESSKGEEEVLTLFRQDSFFPPFVYRTVEIEGEVGITYTLKITVLGKEVTAVTTIPQPPALKEVRYNAENDSMGYLEVLHQRPTSGVLYMFAQIRSTKVDKAFHPSSNPMLSIQAANDESVWQQVWRSRESMLYFSNPKNYYYQPDYHPYQYINTDTIWLKLGAVDSVSFNVLLSMFMDLSNRENPFAFNGNKIQTNIEGGIGRWTGIGVAPAVWICGRTKPLAEIE